MSHTKAILTVSSLGFGAALVMMATAIQRDRFAFTAVETEYDWDSPAAAMAAPAPPAVILEPVVVTGDMAPAIRIQALEVTPSQPRTPRLRWTPAPERVEPAAPPCRPVWRELAAGPEGRMVRELCVPSADDVPRS